MGVYLPGENWATQGPAPDGFHVPLNTERQAVYNIWTALGGGSSDGTNFGIALKLPFAGKRSPSSTVISQDAYYWSSSRYNADSAYNFYFLPSAFYQTGYTRTAGYTIRCFKNSPTIPTSSWTKLYGTSIESGGIFWSSAEGLISLSSDGNTWITIQDKNLGATQVWNSGATLSEANCGKYYQRGNNYGFPFTGSVTTSSTRVDASTYGPGNYYSSSTFITYQGRWDTTDNGNLWGGVDGNVPTMSELNNAYIGEYVPNFATQGPCPDDFHIPTKTDVRTLYNIVTSWGLSNSQIFGYLKMPYSGYRVYTNSNQDYVGSYGYYWEATAWSDSSYLDYAYGIRFNNGQFGIEAMVQKANGCSIRPFKNNASIPDSNWTVLYQGSGSAGIYYNSTEGLISVSSDGTNWVTIADKNLGATIVYNTGDTMNETNCGKYYQRGNNYGFSFSGSLSTSSTQVNASTYGPGNYYSGNKFIKSYNSWDSSNNKNLRGGEDGNVPL